MTVTVNEGRNNSAKSAWVSFTLGAATDKVGVVVPNIEINSKTRALIAPHGATTPTISARWSIASQPSNDELINVGAAAELTALTDFDAPTLARFFRFEAVTAKSAGTVGVATTGGLLYLSTNDTTTVSPATRAISLEQNESEMVSATLSHHIELFRFTVSSADTSKVTVSPLVFVSDRLVKYTITRVDNTNDSVAVTLTAYPADGRTALTQVTTVT